MVQVPQGVQYINYPAYQICLALNTVISFHLISVFLLSALKKLWLVFFRVDSILKKIHLCFAPGISLQLWCSALLKLSQLVHQWSSHIRTSVILTYIDLLYYVSNVCHETKSNKYFHGIFDNFYTQIDFEHLYRIMFLYVFMFSMSRNNRILLKRTNDFVYDLQVCNKDLSPKDYFLACGIGTERVSL